MPFELWRGLLKVAASAIPLLLTYAATLYLYRVFLHPLARYPGPKLAAASNWYEFYYDVIQQGAFTEHIRELHKQYGESSMQYFYVIHLTNCSKAPLSESRPRNYI